MKRVMYSSFFYIGLVGKIVFLICSPLIVCTRTCYFSWMRIFFLSFLIIVHSIRKWLLFFFNLFQVSSFFCICSCTNQWIGLVVRSTSIMSPLDSTRWIGGSAISSVSFLICWFSFALYMIDVLGFGARIWTS